MLKNRWNAKDFAFFYEVHKFNNLSHLDKI